MRDQHRGLSLDLAASPAGRRPARPGRGRRTPTTCQPKARHFSAKGASDISRAIGPVCWYLLWSTMACSRSDLPVRGGHGRLPDLALLALAVAHQDERVVVQLAQAAGQDRAEAERQPLAERAGGVLDAGVGVGDRMAVQAGPECAEVLECFERRITRARQDRVEERSGVALAQDEAVAFGPVGLLGPVVAGRRRSRRPSGFPRRRNNWKHGRRSSQ